MGFLQPVRSSLSHHFREDGVDPVPASIYDTYDADIYSFFSILKLAHRWDFPEVTKFALRELKRRESEIPVVKLIRLYEEYEAPPELLVPLFVLQISLVEGQIDVILDILSTWHPDNVNLRSQVVAALLDEELSELTNLTS